MEEDVIGLATLHSTDLNGMKYKPSFAKWMDITLKVTPEGWIFFHPLSRIKSKLLRQEDVVLHLNFKENLQRSNFKIHIWFFTLIKEVLIDN